MPLAPGSGHGIIAKNALEMMASGHPRDQSWAAAYSNAKRHPHADGGGIAPLGFRRPVNLGIGARPQKQFGGPSVASMTPWFERREAGMEESAPALGFLHAPVGGRTDHLPVSVMSDSHVLPADVVSGMGEGNSLHGAKLIQEMLHTGPWGIPLQQQRRGETVPGGSPPRPPPINEAQRIERAAEAKAGAVVKGHGEGGLVPILAAGGEIILSPRETMALAAHGLGRKPHSLKEAHDAVDRWIVFERKKISKTMAALPPPKTN